MVAPSKVTIDKANLTEEECKQLAALITKSERPLPAFKRAKKGCKYWTLSGIFTTDWALVHYDAYDDVRYKCHNYFLTEEHATNVAAYLKSSMWFINKAVEFAGDYKFKAGAPNYYVDSWISTNNGAAVCVRQTEFTECKTRIYMTEVQAEAFKAWLIKYAPEGELRE